MMGDLIDLIIALIPVILVVLIMRVIMGMFRNQMDGLYSTGKIAPPLDVLTTDEKKESQYDHTLAKIGVPTTTASPTVCKNCKINKALDDGFGLCKMCKEDPGWWMT